MLPLETSPREVKAKLDRSRVDRANLGPGEKIRLIDVREPFEFQQARIEGAELIPMRTVPAELQRLDAIADDETLIVYCHHGVRSLNVVNWLREQGVEACQSMSGGIDQWSWEIDSAVPRY